MRERVGVGDWRREERRGEETELRDICDNNKRPSIYVIRILDRREREELKTQRNNG